MSWKHILLTMFGGLTLVAVYTDYARNFWEILNPIPAQLANSNEASMTLYNLFYTVFQPVAIAGPEHSAPLGMVIIAVAFVVWFLVKKH